MIVVVTGGRGFKDGRRVWTKLSEVNKETPIKVLIQGGAVGTDEYARGWGESPVRKRNGLISITYNANWEGWKKKGQVKRAGHMRNGEQLDLALHLDKTWWTKQDDRVMLLAFPGGKGTENCKRQARERGIEVVEG